MEHLHAAAPLDDVAYGEAATQPQPRNLPACRLHHCRQLRTRQRTAHNAMTQCSNLTLGRIVCPAAASATAASCDPAIALHMGRRDTTFDSIVFRFGCARSRLHHRRQPEPASALHMAQGPNVKFDVAFFCPPPPLPPQPAVSLPARCTRRFMDQCSGRCIVPQDLHDVSIDDAMCWLREGKA